MRHPIPARIVALVAAAAFVGAGCASPKTRRALSSPGASATAGGDAGAGASQGPGASGDTSPKATRKPTPSPTAKAIPEDPARAVAQWLAAVTAEDYQTQLVGAADGARVLTVVRDIIHQENAHRGATTDNTVEIVEAPKTIEVAADAARVSLKTVVHSLVSGEKGKLPEDTTLDGPVALRKIEGKWRITDFLYEGAPLAPGYFSSNAKQTQREFVLTVGAFVSYKDTTAAVIRFTRESGGSKPLRITKASLFAQNGKEHPMTQLAFEYPKTSPAGFIGFERVDGKPKTLRIEVNDDATPPNAWIYEVTF